VIESQITANSTDSLGASGYSKAGQRRTISNSVVSSLGFILSKTGSPTGDITLGIRKVSDNSVIVSKVWGDASLLTTTPTWIEATFATPTLINQEVRIYCQYGGTGTVNVRYQNTDIKANEKYCKWTSSWSYETVLDIAYFYIYEAGSATLAISTFDMSSVAALTATGNGRIDAFGSDGAVTQHGHCWGTTINPTTADSKTTLGAKSTLGTFTSSLTGLLPGTTYYCRAYGTDTGGTVYGVNVAFYYGAPSNTINPVSGNIAVVQTRLHYMGADGKERYIEGTAV